MFSLRRRVAVGLALSWLLAAMNALAQEIDLQPGVAIVTQFSGTAATIQPGLAPEVRIDPRGVVAKVIDLRRPGFDPAGQHWLNEPQRSLVTAAQVGQVFAIALDDDPAPNAYLAASAFAGLHRHGDGWMDGQWGQGGGPGSIWKLDARNGYAPRLFASVTLNGRDNSGAALGDLAFDPYHRQLFVSDLETGMIHAFSVEDAVERDTFDHGLDARSGFLDARTSQSRSLPTVEFDPASRADPSDCVAENVAAAPECWNLADFRRRVWGLSVHRDDQTGEVRLFYALWSNAGFGSSDFEQAPQEEKTNSVWSVALDEAGRFRRETSRLEFLVPSEAISDETGDLFAVSDLAFPRATEQRVMLLGRHRGIITRERDADGTARFPWPDAYWPSFESPENLVWRQQDDGTWQPLTSESDAAELSRPHAPVGRNMAGGVDFGFGYADGSIDDGASGSFVWITANHLCPLEFPCLNIATRERSEVSEVHGLLGMPLPSGQSDDEGFLSDAFLAIDIDVNADAAGNVDIAGLARRNAGAVGDIEVFAPYPEIPDQRVEPVAEEAVEAAEGPLWPEGAQEEPWWPAPPQPSGEAIAGPDLALQKAVPFTCVPGAPCTVVAVVTNIGGGTYASPIRIRDLLPNDWQLTAAGPAGSNWSCQQFGSEAVCTDAGFSLAPGQQHVLVFEAQVPAQQVAGVIRNCAAIEHAVAGIDANAANDEGCTDLAFDGPAPGALAEGRDLSITKHAQQGDCAAGEPCSFTIRIANTGTEVFESRVSFVDLLPAGWIYAAKDIGWWCMLTLGGGDRFACHRQQRLDPGQSVDVSLAIRSPANASGSAENCAALDWSPNERDARPDNDRSCVTVNVKPAVLTTAFSGGDLAIEKTFEKPATTGPTATVGSQCRVGEACAFRFAVKITNVGGTPYFGSVIFNDLLPLGWAYGTMSGAAICETKGGWLSCGFGPPLNLEPGQSLSATIDIRSAPLDKPVTFDVRNCAAIAWQGMGDANAANDTACDDLTVSVTEAPAGQEEKAPGQPTGFGMVTGPQGVGYDLAIEKGPPHAGQATAAGAGALHVCAPMQPCPFVLTVTNTGVVKFDGPFRFVDTPTAGWSYAAVSQGWQCQPGPGGGFTCAGDLSLEPGQSERIDLSLNPMPGVPLEPQPGENCASIDWANGKRDANGANDESCTPMILAAGAPTLPGAEAGEMEGVGPGLTVRKEAVSSTCAPGEECWFNLVISGTQDFPFTGKFNVTDIPPADWKFAGGGKQGLWSCEEWPFTYCTYDVSKYPGLPEGGFTSSDFIATDIRFRVPSDAKEGTYKNCALVTFPPPATGEISKSTQTVCAFVDVANRSKMTITKRFDQAVCVAGAPCPYSIVIKNEGKGEYDGLLTVTDRFEEGPSYQRDTISSGDIDCRGVLGQPAGPFTGAQAKPGEFLCVSDIPFPAGTTRVIAVEGRFSADQAGTKAANCSTLQINRSNASKLSPDERVLLVKQFLRYKGYTVSTASGLSPEDQLALSRYKQESGFKNAGGTPETSGAITDDFVASLLPKHEDYAFEQGETAAELEGILTSCAEVSLSQPGLIIAKKGPPAADFRTPGVKTGTPEAETCALDHECTFTISVTGNSDAPYTQPIVIEDSSPGGWWELQGYEGEGWSCTGTTKLVCTHPPADLSKSKSLELKLTMKPGLAFYQAKQNEKHPWIYNCAKIRYQSAAQYQTQARGEYESCYKLRLIGSDLSDFGYSATGTASCTPPNCSSYEFTAALNAEEPGRSYSPTSTPGYDATGTGNCLPPACGAAETETLGYDGSLSMRITAPRGSAFAQPRITNAPSSCGASAWSCSQRASGGEFVCRIDECRLSPGDKVTVRIEGNVAADLTEPPETEQTREVCSSLEYQGASRPGIEQVVGTEKKNACFATRILAKPRPAECPPGQERDSAGDCVPIAAPVDLVIFKKTIGDCSGQETCRFQITVESKGRRPFNGRVAIRDTFSRPGAVLNQLQGRGSCSQSGQSVDCVIEPEGLAQGNPAVVSLDVRLPHTEGDASFLNCAEIYQPDPTDTSAISRDEIRMLQRVLDHSGFDPGPIDGVVGSRTRNAVSRARASIGLDAGTQVDRALLAVLLGQTPDQSDANPGNNRSCVSTRTPICGPGYSTVRATGECFCAAPRVERDGQCVMPAQEPKPPARPQAEPQSKPVAKIRCDDGRIDSRNRCICPSGWNLKQVQRDWFRCDPPAPEPVTPTPQIKCLGGVMLGGLCICPPGNTLQKLPRNEGFRCVAPEPVRPAPQPQTVPRPPAPAPVQPPMPQLPEFKMICPPGTKWVPEARQCIPTID